MFSSNSCSLPPDRMQLATTVVPVPRSSRTWRRRMMPWALAIVCAYPVLVGVLLALEDALVYMATPASSSWAEPRDLEKEDITLHSADGTRLHAWWCPVKDSRGAVL